MPVVRAISDLGHHQGCFWIFRHVTWGHLAKMEGFLHYVSCEGAFSMGIGSCGNSFWGKLSPFEKGFMESSGNRLSPSMWLGTGVEAEE